MRSEPGTSPILGRALRNALLLLGGLILLRQAIVLLTALVPPMAVQSALVAERGIRPADLFYTEAPLALAAEKAVRARLGADAPEQASLP